MKRILATVLALMLALGCMAVPAMAEEADADVKSILAALETELDARLR